MESKMRVGAFEWNTLRKEPKEESRVLMPSPVGYLPAPDERPVDMVAHPPHYERGPQIECPECGHVRILEHIEVFRAIKDSRLATAFKYIWRVSFGGKGDDLDKDIEDVSKARWYLKDWKDNPA